MNEASLNSSSHYKLEPFLLLSKSVKGVANNKLISDVLDAPGVYVFTELFNAPNVMQAAFLPEVEGYHKLLRIFMYGTWKDYQAQKTQLPTLSLLQTKKLHHLTLVTLSEESQTLSYDRLLDALNIPTIRELEDTIMDAIYNGVLKGKLDQYRCQLEVVKTIGRDLAPGRLAETMEALSSWSTQTAGILGMLDATIDHLKSSVLDNEQQKLDYSHQLEEIRKTIRENKADENNSQTEERRIPNSHHKKVINKYKLYYDDNGFLAIQQLNLVNDLYCSTSLHTSFTATS
ncbi:hypothetical protein BY458DRAFT_444857 [Sporodiniella umbellata]|nr:hypothetical protein BY458DRAFT_444857 [Sporodiniella umbellata]